MLLVFTALVVAAPTDGLAQRSGKSSKADKQQRGFFDAAKQQVGHAARGVARRYNDFRIWRNRRGLARAKKQENSLKRKKFERGFNLARRLASEIFPDAPLPRYVTTLPTRLRRRKQAEYKDIKDLTSYHGDVSTWKKGDPGGVSSDRVRVGDFELYVGDTDFGSQVSDGDSSARWWREDGLRMVEGTVKLDAEDPGVDFFSVEVDARARKLMGIDASEGSVWLHLERPRVRGRGPRAETSTTLHSRNGSREATSDEIRLITEASAEVGYYAGQLLE